VFHACALLPLYIQGTSIVHRKIHVVHSTIKGNETFIFILVGDGKECHDTWSFMETLCHGTCNFQITETHLRLLLGNFLRVFSRL